MWTKVAATGKNPFPAAENGPSPPHLTMVVNFKHPVSWQGKPALEKKAGKCTQTAKNEKYPAGKRARMDA